MAAVTDTRLGRSPRSSPEWVREIERRTTALERAQTARIGPWVLSALAGRLIATKPGGTLEVGQDPEAVVVDLSQRGSQVSEAEIADAITDGNGNTFGSITEWLAAKWAELTTAGTNADTSVGNWTTFLAGLPGGSTITNAANWLADARQNFTDILTGFGLPDIGSWVTDLLGTKSTAGTAGTNASTALGNFTTILSGLGLGSIGAWISDLAGTKSTANTANTNASTGLGNWTSWLTGGAWGSVTASVSDFLATKSTASTAGTNASTALTNAATAQTSANTAQSTATTVSNEQANGWQAIWNGIFKTPTDTTARSTEQVREAAASLSEDVTTISNSNSSLTGIVLAPRQTPLWMSKWPQDDVAFPTISIDGSTAPALGELVLIPVTALASRSYESVKFGLAASPTMLHCYVSIFSVSAATGAATRVRDLGDVRSQLSATANMQSIQITPTPLPATAGQVLLIGVLQVGSIATAMHKTTATAGSAFTTYPISYPKVYGMSHGSGLTAIPSSLNLATSVTASTIYWGALGYGVAPPTDPEAYYTSPLKASTDLDIFEFVTGTASGTTDSVTGLGIPSGVVQNTHYSHLGRFFQPDQYVQAKFTLMTTAAYWDLGLGTASMYLGFRRNPMTGATVYALIRWEVNGIAFGVGTTVKAYADIYTVAAGGYPGSGVLRATAQFINRTESGPGSIPAYTRASTFRFRVVGNVYSVIWNDNGGPTTVATWTDSGGLFPVNEFNNASVVGIIRARASMGFSSTTPPGVSDFIMSDIV